MSERRRQSRSRPDAVPATVLATVVPATALATVVLLTGSVTPGR